MSLVPFTFKNVELKVVKINDKPWTRAKEVCKTLGYLKKTADVIKQLCSPENFAHKHELSKFLAVGNLVNCPLTLEKTTITSMKKGCMRCSLEVNSHWQESSENTVVMSCFRT